MVLNELGQKISQALSMIQNAESIDEKVCTDIALAARLASFIWEGLRFIKICPEPTIIHLSYMLVPDLYAHSYPSWESSGRTVCKGTYTLTRKND